MGRIKIDYGIDLGTTNSALAIINDGLVEVKNIDRSNIVPSCVWYNRKGKVRAGIDALNETNPKGFLEFKRSMGTDWTAKKHPDFEEQVNSEELSAEILKKLKGEITDEQFKSVVITVPALFHPGQVAATSRAGKMAGFEQVEILIEPVAAGFNYIQKNNLKDGKFVVFDFGGGTFDAALIKVEGGVPNVVSSEGDNHLGGKDLDNKVVEKTLLPLLKEEYDIDNLNEDQYNVLKNRMLKDIADELKIKLGKNKEYEFLTDLGDLGNDASGVEMEIEKTFSREEIHGPMKEVFMQAIEITKKLLLRNNITTNDMDALVLVGGPTQIPLFRELIEKELVKPDISLNPMTAIAQGAALYASAFNNKIDSHGAAIGGDDEGDVSKTAVQLEVQYAATTVQDEEAIGIKRKNTSESYAAIVSRSDGWQSERHELDDVIMAPINKGVSNSFKIELFDNANNSVLCSPNKFTITEGIGIEGEGGGSATTSHHYGIAVHDNKRGQIFHSFKGLERDRSLPSIGKTTIPLFNTSEIRPGISEDKMVIPIYFAEAEAEGSRALVNLKCGQLEVNGDDVQKLIPANSSVEFTMEVSVSQVWKLEIEFLDLDIDVIEKSYEFSAIPQQEKKTIDTLFDEIQKGINKLNKSTETVPQLGDFRSKLSYYKSELGNITDGDYEKIFGDLRSFLLEIDIAIENIQWPMLKREVIDTLFNFDQQVKECVDKQLDGWEKDQSDLEHFTKQKEQLFNMPKPDQKLAEELIENIKSASFQINARHQGKEMFTAWILDFDRNFNSIEWKNTSVARQEIDRGLQLVNNGADKGALGSATQAIVSQMKDPNVGPAGGGVSTGD